MRSCEPGSSNGLKPCIGVFDSGVGGLSVLRALQHQLPDVSLRYLADTAHAPYGERSAEFIIDRSLELAARLVDQGAALLVMACNTATAHAIQTLRQRWPLIPILATEPGIKPAVAASRNGRIGVMATPATIASARYQALLSRHAGVAQVVNLPCPGLADLIEQGEIDSAAMKKKLKELCEPLHAANVDTVLMGCTHYPFVQSRLQAEMGPAVLLLNIEIAVAQQAAKSWNELSLQSTAAPVSISSTGDSAGVTRFIQRVLGWQGIEAISLID